MTDIYYAATAFICFICAAGIGWKGLSLFSNEEKIRRNAAAASLVVLLIFFLADGIWGVIAVDPQQFGNTAYFLSTTAFHLMAAVVVFAWTGHILMALGRKVGKNILLKIFRIIILCVPLVLLITNFVNGQVFVITDSCVYEPGPLRPVLFYFQMAGYGLTSFIALIVFLRTRGTKNTWHLLGFITALVPLVTGFLQMQFPDAPFYSMGLTVALMMLAITYLSYTLERKNAALEDALRQTQAANAAKTAFLFNMSHDIRTPMNAILGFTAIAQKFPDDKQRVADAHEKISAAGQHLLELINNILDMSRIEAGKTVIDLKPLNLTKNSMNLAAIVRGSAVEKSIDLKENFGKLSHEVVLADRLHLNEILLNILNNAIKYTHHGGKVVFSMEELADPSEKGLGYHTYKFTVSDTGIGMSPEFAAKIFDEFSREETSTVSKIQGTGLGMSIVKHLTDLMGGTVTVSSEQGKGTTVVVLLSFEEGVMPAEPEKIPVSHPDFLKGKRVLVVEDNELNREIAEDILTDMNISTESVEDGSDAVKLLKEKGPRYFDCVLMDVQMPVMDGYEATRAIRAFGGEYLNLPILAMTANAFEEDKKNALAAGMNDHLGKPIEVNKLTEALLHYIQKKE
ncbi:MAG TPA: response regulator [Methanocorpusculum sp.]|nr:response regulator [Methanocorpusculum sp.]